MNLHEAQDRLKKTEINEEQLQQIHPLYILMDIHKDEFCKMIDIKDLTPILEKSEYYEWLLEAMKSKRAEERYIYNKRKLADLLTEVDRLKREIENYENEIKKLLE